MVANFCPRDRGSLIVIRQLFTDIIRIHTITNHSWLVSSSDKSTVLVEVGSNTIQTCLSSVHYCDNLLSIYNLPLFCSSNNLYYDFIYLLVQFKHSPT